MTTTTKASYETLLAFMDSKLRKGSTIEDWNNARAEAKAIYPMELINKLDSSGVVVSFNLLPKPE